LREKFERAARHASRMVSKHPSLPVLGCVLLETKKSTLSIRSTNIDISFEALIPAKIEREGIMAVQGGALTSFLSGVTSTAISFEGKPGGFALQGGNTRATLKIFPHDDFPSFTAPREYTHTFSVAEVVAGLKSVLYASSPSSVRPELGSIYIFSENSSMVFVATDSFRLAEKRIVPHKPSSFPPTLVPVKNASELLRILLEAEGDACVLSSGEGQFAAFANGMSFISRTLEGSFPDYKQIIPKEAETTVTALKDDMAKALQLASALSEKSNQVSLTVPEKERELVLSVKNAEVGEGVSRIQASVNGKPFEASFNARYLSDCLGAINESSITLSFAGAGKPLLISGAGSAGFRYIVMPMNR